MENPVFLIAFLIIFCGFGIPLVLAIVVPVQRRHDAASRGVVNYDILMRKFVYKVNLPKSEIIRLLQVKNVADELSCTLDLERSVMLFSEYGSHREFYFDIREYNGFSIMRLEEVSRFDASGHVPLKLNPFMACKLDAEIVPYSKYGL